jgi:hypothetical protein
VPLQAEIIPFEPDRVSTCVGTKILFLIIPFFVEQINIFYNEKGFFNFFGKHFTGVRNSCPTARQYQISKFAGSRGSRYPESDEFAGQCGNFARNLFTKAKYRRKFAVFAYGNAFVSGKFR